MHVPPLAPRPAQQTGLVPVGRANRTPTPQRNGLLRRYHVSSLNEAGHLTDFQRIAPALPVFEAAFSAFARGSIVATDEGPVAVEDLMPGMNVQTACGDYAKLVWIGSTAHVPSQTRDGEHARLTRISADSFGLGRPMPDLLLGPSARLFQENTKLSSQMGSKSACLPAAGFVDGETVISVTPVSSVQLFHLGFESQQIIHVNGLDCESYHPGATTDQIRTDEMLSVFLSLFPHCRTLEDFGPTEVPSLTLDEMERFHAA
ncbi:Hint domain-containing protein [Aliiroseovarius sp. YM-037]|uniref:Hint domain-containing protein n=1 Tax=Aliiroseovarius sp. YM-037 TaxID=3341728 RepID=UPI003A80DA23